MDETGVRSNSAVLRNQLLRLRQHVVGVEAGQALPGRRTARIVQPYLKHMQGHRSEATRVSGCWVSP